MLLLRASGQIVVLLFLFLSSPFVNAHAQEDFQPDEKATQVVREAIDYWRSDSSRVKAEMTVHRPEWERTMSLVTLTEGTDHSLVRFTAPPKDAGSASLKIENELWSFSPKIRRVVKIPSSMMHQSWMGSDFSYNDLARDDEIVEYYFHRFLPEETHEGKRVYVVEARPKTGAPVVWGKEIVKVREDKILLEHSFYDQEMVLVKKLSTQAIQDFDGKLFPKIMKMERLDQESQWTQIQHLEVEFDIAVPALAFTLGYLQNPR